jgi:hypothetical protein
MKNNFRIGMKTSLVPALVVGSLLTWGMLIGPSAARAEDHGRDGGRGRSFSGGRSFGGGQAFSGQRGFSGGQNFSARGGNNFSRGHSDNDQDWNRGRRNSDRGRSPGGFSFGFFSTPSYGYGYDPYFYGPSYSDPYGY